MSRSLRPLWKPGAGRTLWIPAITAIGILLAVAVAGWLAWSFLGAGRQDLQLLTLYLMLTGSGSLLMAHLVIRGIDRTRFGRFRTRLILTPVLAVGVSLLNIFATAYLMFFDAHDFRLLLLLQVFALIVALTFALSVSTGLADQVEQVVAVARRLAGGDLTARADPSNEGEIGQLTRAINYLGSELERSARQQQEIETARRNLLAAISHDLRTPLASMRAMIEAITDEVVTDEDTVRRYLTTTRAEVNLLSRLIDDLFDLAKIEAGAMELRREPASIEDLLSDTLEGMQLHAGAQGIELTGKVCGTVTPVSVDPAKIQRVLANLVLNAIEHTPRGGTVHLTVRPRSGSVEVAVQDSGEGIAESELPHIFDQFYRSDPARRRKSGGTGLGLAIARGIVEAHGGTIEAASRRGEGSTFRFTLPDQPATARDVAVNAAPSGNESKPRSVISS